MFASVHKSFKDRIKSSSSLIYVLRDFAITNFETWFHTKINMKQNHINIVPKINESKSKGTSRGRVILRKEELWHCVMLSKVAKH